LEYGEGNALRSCSTLGCAGQAALLAAEFAALSLTGTAAPLSSPPALFCDDDDDTSAAGGGNGLTDRPFPMEPPPPNLSQRTMPRLDTANAAPTPPAPYGTAESLWDAGVPEGPSASATDVLPSLALPPLQGGYDMDLEAALPTPSSPSPQQRGGVATSVEGGSAELREVTSEDPHADPVLAALDALDSSEERRRTRAARRLRHSSVPNEGDKKDGGGEGAPSDAGWGGDGGSPFAPSPEQPPPRLSPPQRKLPERPAASLGARARAHYNQALREASSVLLSPILRTRSLSARCGCWTFCTSSVQFVPSWLSFPPSATLHGPSLLCPLWSFQPSSQCARGGGRTRRWERALCACTEGMLTGTRALRRGCAPPGQDRPPGGATCPHRSRGDRPARSEERPAR